MIFGGIMARKACGAIVASRAFVAANSEAVGSVSSTTGV